MTRLEGPGESAPAAGAERAVICTPFSADRADPGAHTGRATAGLPSGVGEAVRAAVRTEFDEVLHHVVDALARNRAFDELSDRLRAAERRLETRRERPLVVAVHALLTRLRHLNFDQAVKHTLEKDLVKILNDAGFDETGRVGEVYDPARHDALDGRVVDGQGTVTQVHARGLESFGDVIVRALVGVSPGRAARTPADDGSRRESVAGSAQ